jgi:hypothetical protein
VGKKADSTTHTKLAVGSTLARSRRGKTLKKTDGLYSIIGIGVSKVPGGTSTNKHHRDK